MKEHGDQNQPSLTQMSGAATHIMLAADTNSLIDSLVLPLLETESRDLRTKINKRAAQDVAQRVSGSGFALFARVRVHYEHHRDLAAAVCSAMLRVLTETDVEPYPELAADLSHKFDAYLSAPADRTRSSMVAFSQMGHAMPKETFDDLCKEVHQKAHTEIQLYCRAAGAKRRRHEEGHMAMNITYNLTGENPRVNINSQDYSINIANAGAIFRQLADAISSGVVEDALRDTLLRKTEDMQSAVSDKNRFRKLYGEFIALAANHMTVISPFVPALTQFLGP